VSRNAEFRWQQVFDARDSLPGAHKRIPGQKIELPARQKAGGYKEPNYPYKFVDERF